MKITKLGIRFLIMIASTVSFLGGWIMLAHAPKPFQGTSSQQANTTLPTLEPLAPLSDFGSGQNNFQSQTFFNTQPRARSNPFFTTGGS